MSVGHLWKFLQVRYSEGERLNNLEDKTLKGCWWKVSTLSLLLIQHWARSNHFGLSHHSSRKIAFSLEIPLKWTDFFIYFIYFILFFCILITFCFFISNKTCWILVLAFMFCSGVRLSDILSRFLQGLTKKKVRVFHIFLQFSCDFFWLSIYIVEGATSGLKRVLASEIPLKIKKSFFYFTLKSLFISKCLNFCLDFSVMEKNGLIRKIRLIS